MKTNQTTTTTGTYAVTFDRPARLLRPAAQHSVTVVAESWSEALTIGMCEALGWEEGQRFHIERRRREAGDPNGTFRGVVAPTWQAGGGTQIGSGWRFVVRQT